MLSNATFLPTGHLKTSLVYQQTATKVNKPLMLFVISSSIIEWDLVSLLSKPEIN